MPLDIEKCRRGIRPANIFELLREEIVLQMIRGFFYQVRKGVALLHTEYDVEQRRWVVSEKRLDAFPYGAPEGRPFYNRLCWEFRTHCGETKCCECDRRIAEDYTEGTRNSVASYTCWLGLEEFSYPIRVGGHVRAILFSGQVVPSDDGKVREIEAKIHEHAESSLREKLFSALRTERNRRKPSHAAVLHGMLCEFGQMMEDVLSRVYEARKEAVIREVLQTGEDGLASADHSDAKAWWDNCATLLASFASLAELSGISVYVRDRHYYQPRPARDVSHPPIAVRDVLSTLSAGRVQLATENSRTRQLAEAMRVCPDTTRFYLSHALAERTPLSTLLVVRGAPNAEYEALTASFCRIVTQRADFFSLVEHQRLAQSQFRETVAQVAHDFRTPLQVLMFDLQEIARIDAIQKDPARLAQVRASIERAQGAEEHVQHLMGVMDRARKVLDLVALVKGVVTDLEPMAKQHPCRLRRANTWPDKVTIRGVEYQLRRAITNLLDNAIKYSWGGKFTDGRLEPHTVDVGIEPCNNGMVRVWISNYGIGIPLDRLQQLGEPGCRALVPDRRVREGSGRGIPIAIRILEEHDGWLVIDSKPSDAKPRPRGQEYHRYTTMAEAYLPLAK